MQPELPPFGTSSGPFWPSRSVAGTDLQSDAVAQQGHVATDSRAAERIALKTPMQLNGQATIASNSRLSTLVRNILKLSQLSDAITTQILNFEFLSMVTS